MSPPPSPQMSHLGGGRPKKFRRAPTPSRQTSAQVSASVNITYILHGLHSVVMSQFNLRSRSSDSRSGKMVQNWRILIINNYRIQLQRLCIIDRKSKSNFEIKNNRNNSRRYRTDRRTVTPTVPTPYRARGHVPPLLQMAGHGGHRE